jgi:hypothetical protein
LPVIGESFGALSELPPAFIASSLVAVVVSLLDTKGRRALMDVKNELRDAA